jgi:class 3 adenylate cyclase
MLVEGLTLLRASQLETTPTLLCVIDAGTAAQVGGTLMTLERWKRCVGAPEIIDLRDLRSRPASPMNGAGHSPSPVAGPADDAPASVDPPQRSSPRSAVPSDAERPRRTLKTILFADFAGYSRLHDAYAPLFQGRFWNIVADEIKAATAKPLMANTWGDALYVVFESPVDGAEFALRLLASMQAVDWTAAGLSDSSQIRVALHAGPVFTGFDPIIGRDNCFGSSVTRTARIEPVTPPGMIYASEAFAATVAATGVDGYALEYIGQLPLAKGYGDSRIYRLERRVA